MKKIINIVFLVCLLSLATFAQENIGDINKLTTPVIKSGGSPSNCYAVLLNGGRNSTSNYECWYNSLAFVYETLVNEYSYDEDNIYVLNSDGTSTNADMLGEIDEFPWEDTIDAPQDLDGDNDGDIDYSATVSNLEDVFDELSTNLTTSDFLFVFITGRADVFDKIEIELWNNTSIDDDDFATLVNSVNAGEIVVINTCDYGATIIDDLADSDRIICSGTGGNETAIWKPDKFGYDEFCYYWTSAMAGETPTGTSIDADSDSNGYITIKEAFSYAEDYSETYYTPQYDSDKYTLWENVTLLGKEICISTEPISFKTYTQSETVEDCNITASYVTINSGVSVVYDSEVSTILSGNVTVNSGATFLIY